MTIAGKSITCVLDKSYIWNVLLNEPWPFLVFRQIKDNLMKVCQVNVKSCETFSDLIITN